MMFLKIVECLLLWNLILNFLLYFTFSLKLLTYSKNSSNPLQMLWSGDFDHEKACGPEISFRKSPRTYKFTRIFPASNEGWTFERIDQWQRGKTVQKLWCGRWEQSLKLVRVLRDASKYLYLFFSSTWLQCTLSISTVSFRAYSCKASIIPSIIQYSA